MALFSASLRSAGFSLSSLSSLSSLFSASLRSAGLLSSLSSPFFRLPSLGGFFSRHSRHSRRLFSASLRSAFFSLVTLVLCYFVLCVFPIGLIGLIGLIAPIGLIALGFLRERLIGSLDAASRLSFSPCFARRFRPTAGAPSGQALLARVVPLVSKLYGQKKGASPSGVGDAHRGDWLAK